MYRTLIQIASAIIVGIIVIIGGIWLFRTITQPGAVFGPRPTPTPAPAAPPFSTLVPMNATDISFDPSVSKVRFFDRMDGQLKEVDLQGQVVSSISETKFSRVVRTRWSPKSNSAILEYFPEAGDQYTGRAISFFDPEKNQSVDLNTNIRELAWSPDANGIVYHFRDDTTGANNIAISKPDGSSFKILASTTLLDLKLFWPSQDVIFVTEKPAVGIPGIIFRIDVKTDTMKQVAREKERFGISILPSPDGKKVLVSSFDSTGAFPTLETITVADNSVKILPFQTLAEKCVWGRDNETIYCAVPAQITEKNLPFAYWTGETHWQDTFLKYRIGTDEKSELAPMLLGVDAIGLVMPQTEDYISYFNRYTGSLDAIKL